MSITPCPDSKLGSGPIRVRVGRSSLIVLSVFSLKDSSWSRPTQTYTRYKYFYPLYVRMVTGEAPRPPLRYVVILGISVVHPNRFTRHFPSRRSMDLVLLSCRSTPLDPSEGPPPSVVRPGTSYLPVQPYPLDCLRRPLIVHCIVVPGSGSPPTLGTTPGTPTFSHLPYLGWPWDLSSWYNVSRWSLW